MKIKVTEMFSHLTGCYSQGKEYDVDDQLGEEVVNAGLAIEVKAEVKPKKKDKEQAE